MGLTQVRLAAFLGVSFASVNRWENGQSRPSAIAWRQILRAEQGGLTALADRDSPAPLAAAEVSEDLPPDPAYPDFTADPTVVWAVSEAHRLGAGHLFNPAFATETSLIHPLPHQRFAVYERMLPEARLRFLLADDAGAGKTIMTGLYVREMLSRRLLRRVLIISPAGLVGNWEREMRMLFSLPFSIVSGADARLANPFVGSDSDLVIVSLDTLAGDRVFGRLQEPAVTPYDLAVFDEAHKLSADRQPDLSVRRTDRYRLAETLAGIQATDPRWTLGWAPRHLLLLTATPHMGKDVPYFYLWRLLEPGALPTIDAFRTYPPDARRRHFLRRAKEEMVRFDGSRIYPTRVSDTLSYDLTQGGISEQRLYDEASDYMRAHYNRARILNRSAARLAMSVFQRRLASSTRALLRSLERRSGKLDDLIEAIRSGRMSAEQLLAAQRRLETLPDVLDERTADEETAERGREENELAEDAILGGVVATSLADLETERAEVDRLLALARQVADAGEESKFERLREVLRDSRFQDEKVLIFTEYRDTLEFLVRRLEGLGLAGRVAAIHGGMHWTEREAEVERFRQPAAEGGAVCMIATDAAGEGINLQFCWLMVNYDVPWNPARLEQRMGRVHRYGQAHDPVHVINLVAGKTREGGVLATLLHKLEGIRRELGSDKVFDVIGRLFEGISLKEYLEASVTEDGAGQASRALEGRLTKEQVLALAARERLLFGAGGDVRAVLDDQKAKLDREELRRLLPGYVRRFVERATPLLGIGVDGDLDGEFSLKPLVPLALDPLWPVLERYPEACRHRLTVNRPRAGVGAHFLHPGEPVLDRLRALVSSRFAREALKGAVYVDPYATHPYLLHLARISVTRRADPGLPALGTEQLLEYRLVGLRQDDGGSVEECPVERLLLLKGGQGIPVDARPLLGHVRNACETALAWALERLARPLAEAQRAVIRETLAERAEFVVRGFDYQDAELAAARARLGEKARAGDPRAQGELTALRERQRRLAVQRGEALALLRREPELIEPDEVTFLAHALVVPSADPEDRKRHDAEVEAIAVRLAVAHEETQSAVVRDVSTPVRATAAGLGPHPGFDLLSTRPSAGERAIEVKGRAGTGDIEVTENEWAKACTLRQRYWLYVAYDCGSPRPRLLRVRDPFGALIARIKGGVLIGADQVLAAAEE
jgi:superfamily II DNA or RNA helicase